MYNKSKVKKKIISIALALVMTASSVASLPMNVFAGTVYAGKQKNAATTASPHVVYDFDIKNVIELDSGQTFNLNDHVTNIRPQGAAFEYVIEYLFDNTEIFDIDRKVIKPGLAKVTVDVGNVSKKTYIIADINGILKAAADSAAAASSAAHAHAIGAAVYAAIYATADAYGKAKTVWNIAKDACYAALDAFVEADNTFTFFPGIPYEWLLKISFDACHTALDEELDLKSKLKAACSAYGVAETVWTKLNNQDNVKKCQDRADALQEVINACYSGQG